MTYDKRSSDAFPMVHWVKRGQCEYTYIFLARFL